MGNSVKEQFDDVAEQYDSQRKKLIPCFDDFYGVSVSVLESASQSPRILDIGAGTGILSALVAEKYPKARFTLVDFSDQMLEIAKRRFAGECNVAYIVADYLKYDFSESYDMIISALSIHHLDDAEKRTLYRKAFELLNPGGMFLNADQVKAASDYMEAMNKTKWKQSIRESGLSESEIQSAFERIKLDKEAALEEQLAWLKDAGFTDVDCSYKYFHFAVISGRKP